MPINVLAFAGSPRRGGNSETLLDWVIDSMEQDPDVHVEKIPIVDADINPCKGCNACETLNYCVQKDGMVSIHDKIIEADIIILASPIFCMGVSSQAKALIDRAQVFRSRKYVLKLPIVPPDRKGKRLGVFLATAGQTWDRVFDGASHVGKVFFSRHRCPGQRYSLPYDQRGRRERSDSFPSNCETGRRITWKRDGFDSPEQVFGAVNRE